VGTTVIDRVTTPQPGDSRGLWGGKFLLMLVLAPTGFGTLIACYFIFCGFWAWLDKRNEPGYVPFRVRPMIWVYLFLALLPLCTIAWLAWPEWGTTPLVPLGMAAYAALVIWLGLLPLRFAFHLVDVRHGSGKQKVVKSQPTSEELVRPILVTSPADDARFATSASPFWQARAKQAELYQQTHSL
jgi:hypothetical protein